MQDIAKLTAQNMSTRRASGAQGEQIISLAILAVGGQGGGVLTNWIVAVAEANGYLVQSTSVAGVAQRTGATIYYIEMCRDTGKAPVFTLAPAEQDVDILISAELMEAGRAVMRGFINPEFTTLIASTHRINAISEKMAPGDGRVDESAVMAAMQAASDRLIAFDMDQIARDAGTMISASLFGALAGSAALPFPRDSFATAMATSRGAAASKQAFDVAYDAAQTGAVTVSVAKPPPVATADVTGPMKLQNRWQALQAECHAFAQPGRDMALAGLKKTIDYQDIAYGDAYLRRVQAFATHDTGDGILTETAAKYLAKAMCYDDVIRVADLKTRSQRLRRLRHEVQAGDDQMVELTEYFHPRFEEFYLGLPVSLGKWVADSPRLRRFFERRFAKGRRIRSQSLTGFLALWGLSALRPWRRRLLRHEIEMAHLEVWQTLALDTAAAEPELACEILATHRLIKGYSDTHARGQSKFDKVIAAVKPLSGRPDAADWLRRLRVAALEDVEGNALDNALKTVGSFN